MRVVQATSTASILVAAALGGCGSDPIETGDDSDPVAAGIRVTVVTDGSAPDPDGYLLSIDHGPVQRIGVNGSVSLGELSEGSHEVVIDDVAANCRVDGAPKRTVLLEKGRIVGVDFTLRCPGPMGTVRMEVATSGPDADGDGYMVMFGSAPPVRVLPNTIAEVAVEAGDRAVVVTGMAPNCAAAADNPTTVLVKASRVVTLILRFTCTAASGAVHVVIVTTGTAMDFDGYQVEAEWLSMPFAIGISAGVTIPQVRAGTAALTLGGVQRNCEVEGGATHAVGVIAGDTVEARFVVRCTAFAALTVNIVKTGIAGPSSFPMRVAYGNTEFTTPVSANGSTTVQLPFAGVYRIRIFYPFCTRIEQTVVVDTSDGTLDLAIHCPGRPRERP